MKYEILKPIGSIFGGIVIGIAAAILTNDSNLGIVVGMLSALIISRTGDKK